MPPHPARHARPAGDVLLGLIFDLLISIDRKVDRMTTQQDTLNALVAQEGVDLDDLADGLSLLGEGIQNVALEIQALQNDNPAVDFTGLQDKVQKLSAARGLFDTAVSSVQALETPAPVTPGGDANPAAPADPSDPAPADPAAPADPDAPVASPSAKSAK